MLTSVKCVKCEDCKIASNLIYGCVNRDKVMATPWILCS